MRRSRVAVSSAGALMTAALALAALPAPTEAQFPYDRPPPSWWTETLGPGAKTIVDRTDKVVKCVPGEVTTVTAYSLVWGPFPGGVGTVGPSDRCERHWGGFDVICTGAASHFTSGGYGGQFTCEVAQGFCGRDYIYLGDTYQTDTGWDPYDCRSLLPGWPNRPIDDVLAEGAQLQKQIKRAKKRLRKADTAKEKRKARLRLKRTKQKYAARIKEWRSLTGEMPFPGEIITRPARVDGAPAGRSEH